MCTCGSSFFLSVLCLLRVRDSMSLSSPDSKRTSWYASRRTLTGASMSHPPGNAYSMTTIAGPLTGVPLTLEFVFAESIHFFLAWCAYLQCLLRSLFARAILNK